MVWARSGLRGGWRRWHGLAFADDGDFLEHDGSQWLIVAVALDAGDGFDDIDAWLVALAEEGVVLVERFDGLLGDEELAAVGVGTGVGHGQLAGLIEVEVRI